MRAGELVVPIARDHERGRRSEPPTKQPKHIECPLVGPVHVLEHDDRRHPGCELAKQRGRHLVRTRLALHQLIKLATRHLCDVDERAERPRCGQRVARAPQDARRGSLLVAEAPQ